MYVCMYVPRSVPGVTLALVGPAVAGARTSLPPALQRMGRMARLLMDSTETGKEPLLRSTGAENQVAHLPIAKLAGWLWRIEPCARISHLPAC